MKNNQVNRYIAAIVVALCIFGSVVAEAQDQCKDVLQDGIRDQYAVSNQTNLKSSFQSGFCSSLNSSSGNSSGGGVGISVPLADALLGLKGNFNEDQKQSMKNKYCGSGSSDLSDDDYVAMMKRVASQQIVEAWVQCMHEHAPIQAQNGLTSDIQTAGGADFIFRFRWIAAFKQNDARVADFFASHATCVGNDISKGAVIGNGWSIAQCTRQGNDPVMVTLEAADQLGATTQILPGSSASLAAQNDHATGANDVKAQCMSGEATACSTLWKNQKDNCGNDVACKAQAQCWSDKSRALTLIKISCSPDQNGNVNQQVCDNQKQYVARQAQMDCEHF